MTGDLRCDNCMAEIPPDRWNQPAVATCPFCYRELWASVFPAIGKSARGAGAEAIGSESEASCYYHPQSRAAVACDACGRFLCGLCDLDIGGHHTCPACLQKGVSAQSAKIVDTRRVKYDSIVLTLSIGGFLLLFWPSAVTAPLSIILAAWNWRKQTSIVPRGKGRFIAAILIAGVQLIFWALVIYSMFTAASLSNAAKEGAK